MNTVSNFVIGYLALWIILFGSIGYLIFQMKKLEGREKESKKI